MIAPRLKCRYAIHPTVSPGGMSRRKEEKAAYPAALLLSASG